MTEQGRARRSQCRESRGQLLLAQPPESPAQQRFPAAEAAGPGGSSPTQEGKHRVENNPAPGNFVLFSVALCSWPSFPRRCCAGVSSAAFGWLILPGDPCELLRAQMENKHRLIPLRMEQLRWEVHLSKCSSQKCSQTSPRTNPQLLPQPSPAPLTAPALPGPAPEGSGTNSRSCVEGQQFLGMVLVLHWDSQARKSQHGWHWLHSQRHCHRSGTQWQEQPEKQGNPSPAVSQLVLHPQAVPQSGSCSLWGWAGPRAAPSCW